MRLGHLNLRGCQNQFRITLGSRSETFVLPSAAVSSARQHHFAICEFKVLSRRQDIGYFVFVGCAWASDVLLEQKMNSFDLDGDGGIGGDELTPEAQEAIDDWASDSGRTLAFITGLPGTAIWTAICLTPLCVGEWIVRRLFGRRNPEATRSEVINRPSDDGNPSQPTPGANK